ncbi:MAG: sugar kinase [Defluviitaleaceae bacterium]|nr:sugar kinase [Defluviitaleaceae bacterium]
MSKIVCFGEIMLRLAPPGYQRFTQADTFEAVYGGGEANVAVSLANFGLEASYITKIPNNPIGQSAINELRRYGVDTCEILRGGQRLGIYFLEKGASQRASVVVYDRKYSSISEVKLGEFDWGRIFKGAKWFHFTGITPALSKAAADVTMEAAKAAKKLGITVSCDLNYRKNLWTPDEAGKVMSGLMPYVDLCIANEEDAEKVFGIKADETEVSEGKLSHEAYKQVAKKLKDKFSFKKVAITLRESMSADDNIWSGMLYDGENYHFSQKYDIHIVDRVGGGDSFAAGLIYGMMRDMTDMESLEFAVAASCLKHSIEGDANHVSAAEVKALMGGDASGRVKR